MTLLSNADARNSNFVSASGVLPNRGLFDDWMAYPSKQNSLEQIKSYTKLFVEIRNRNFDALFYLMTRNRSQSLIKRDVIFFKLAGIKKILGAKYLAANLLDKKFSGSIPKIVREQDFFLESLKNENIPIPAEISKPELLLSESEREDAEKWLKQNCGSFFEQNKLIAVAPSSNWKSKIWEEEKFFKVVERLITEKKIFPIVFGSGEEKEKGIRLIEKWQIGANAAGELNVRRAAAALERCLMYLGNDTGTMHLAASVGVPCVALFSAVDRRGRWQPFGENHVLFRSEVECEGCLLSNCPYNNLCLKKISGEEVAEACLQILKNVR